MHTFNAVCPRCRDLFELRPLAQGLEGVREAAAYPLEGVRTSHHEPGVLVEQRKNTAGRHALPHHGVLQLQQVHRHGGDCDRLAAFVPYRQTQHRNRPARQTSDGWPAEDETIAGLSRPQPWRVARNGPRVSHHRERGADRLVVRTHHRHHCMQGLDAVQASEKLIAARGLESSYGIVAGDKGQHSFRAIDRVRHLFRRANRLGAQRAEGIRVRGLQAGVQHVHVQREQRHGHDERRRQQSAKEEAASPHVGPSQEPAPLAPPGVEASFAWDAGASTGD